MKHKLATLIFLFMVLATIAKAQVPPRTIVTPPTVQHTVKYGFEVKQVQLSLDSLRPAANGQTGYYKAAITSTGKGWVYYEWVLTANRVNAPLPHIVKDSILLGGAGMDNVYRQVSVLQGSPTSLKMQVTSPNIAGSNTESY